MTAGQLGGEILARIEALARISEEPDHLTRTFLSPAQRRASALVQEWMAAAGMTARIDAIGNVIGRYEGTVPGRPALLIGSHLDTVRDAGKYDGMLGVVTAIACLGALNQEGVRCAFPIEVIGFCDEEGVRFGATMLGSRALAGTFAPALLAQQDDHGVSMAEALQAYGLDPARIPAAARQRDEIAAYLELHIEQGPVLEARGLPVGCVSAISGTTRLAVALTGRAGHAGTVPMAERQDALAAAAQCILAIERRARAEAGLVGTVGKIEAKPGATNVIPGEVRFTVDLRAPDDAQRRQAVADVEREIGWIAAARRVGVAIDRPHELAAAPCAPWLMRQIDAAIAAQGLAPLHLPSGAGHDGMAMTAITDIGMIFVRCAGGVSHHPAEAITGADAETGARVLLHVIRNFAPKDDGA